MLLLGRFFNLWLNDRKFFFDGFLNITLAADFRVRESHFRLLNLIAKKDISYRFTVFSSNSD
jgi:hypothetical protein